MARPQKNGLDYMTLDIDIFSSITIRYISARYNSPGIIVCIRLLTEIYRKGYYLPWDDITKYTLVDALPKDCDANLVDNVIQDLLNLNFFNQDLYEAHHILTSYNIQDRYFEAKKKVGKVFTELKYLLIKDKKESESQETTEVNLQKTEVNLQKTTTKKRKENQRIYPPYNPPLGDGEEVFSELTTENQQEKSVITPELSEYNQALSDKKHNQYNLDGLVRQLDEWKATNYQKSIILSISHFGKIGHPVWAIISQCRNSKSIVDKPQYVLSSLKKHKETNL